MATSNEERLENWRESVRGSAKRGLWVTLAFLLPALVIAVILTRFSAEAVDQRDRQIAALHDSLELITERRPLTSPPVHVENADTLALRLYEENQRLHDSLRSLGDSLSGLQDPRRQLEDVLNQLEGLRKRQIVAQTTNEELCRSLASYSSTIERLSASRRVDSALVARLLDELERNRQQCERLLRQVESLK